MEPPGRVAILNEASLKKALINLEKRFVENQKLRIKHADDPTKFAMSETELFASLNEIQDVASMPELYHILISKKSLKTFMTLLEHENTDISAKVIIMLQEMTDPPDNALESESTETLVEALVEENIIGLIAANLSRFTEEIEEEAQAINSSLDVIENLLQFEVKMDAKQSELLMKWIIESFKRSPMTFNKIKTTASGTLATMLVADPANKILFGKLGGIDVLLQQVAPYRLKGPETSDEREFLEQTFDNISMAIIDCEENREIFYNDEGIDLIKLIFFEKTPAVRKSEIKYCALKLLSCVLTSESEDNSCVTKCCERFIEVYGLKVIFPFLEKTSLVMSDKSAKSPGKLLDLNVHEYGTTIILSLLKHCRNTEYIQRLLTKLAESNFDKLDCIISIWQITTTRFERWTEDQGDNISTKKDELRRERLTRAKFIVNTCVYIILLVCYLSQQYDTHDPISGQTFMKYFRDRFKLGTQVTLEEQIVELQPELEIGSPVYNSFQLIVEHYQKSIRPNLNNEKYSEEE